MSKIGKDAPQWYSASVWDSERWDSDATEVSGDPAPGERGVPLWFDVSVWDSVTNETWGSSTAIMGDLADESLLTNAINDAVTASGNEEPGSWVIATVLIRPNNPYEYTIITRNGRGDTSVINAALMEEQDDPDE